RTLLSASITTDRMDYPPGSTAVITGTGWQPHETVDLHIFNVTTDSDEASWTAAADSSGDVSTTLTIGEWDGDSLRMDATGETSGRTAGAISRGREKRGGGFPPPPQPPPPFPGGSPAPSHPPTPRGTQTSSGGPFTADISLTGLPAGASLVLPSGSSLFQ